MRHLLIALLCGLFSLSIANAQDDDVLEMISAKKFALLEKHFASVDSKFEQHNLAERDLVDAYRPFYQRSDVLTGYLTKWIEKQPTSYVARLARGIYFRKLGELNRGRDYVSNTPPEKLEYMTKMYALAKEDLGVALQLRPNSYLVALHLLNLAQSEGDRESARKYLELANKDYPENFMARARYLTSLEPRWGGSHALMNAFIQETKGGGASEQQLRWLRAIEQDDRGAVSLEQGNAVGAREHFVEALRLSDDAGQRFRADYLQNSSWYCLELQRGGRASCFVQQ